MHKRILTLLLFVISSATLLSQPDTLLIVHPTVSSIQTFLFLSESGTFPLENYHFLGVYHSREAYDYEESQSFLADNEIEHFSLLELTDPLSDNELYMENACSDDFLELFKTSKGAFFLGGPDIPPHLYTGSINLLSRITDPFRNYFELSFLWHLLGSGNSTGPGPYLNKNRSYLVSGICLGMQSINVATGGSLYQDIPTDIYNIKFADELIQKDKDVLHRNYSDYLEFSDASLTSYHFHRIVPEKKGFISKRMHYRDAYPEVLSSHHQALKLLGHDLKVAALSVDGQVIEAIEHRRYKNVFGVQFHPEKQGLFDPEIVHQLNTDSTIQFNCHIKDSPSIAFHQAYWNMLAEILNR